MNMSVSGYPPEYELTGADVRGQVSDGASDWYHCCGEMIVYYII